MVATKIIRKDCHTVPEPLTNIATQKATLFSEGNAATRNTNPKRFPLKAGNDCPECKEGKLRAECGCVCCDCCGWSPCQG